MPYEIRHTKEGWCVYNKDTGANKGCSDSEETAHKHMSALYANEPSEAEKAAGSFGYPKDGEEATYRHTPGKWTFSFGGTNSTTFAVDEETGAAAANTQEEATGQSLEEGPCSWGAQTPNLKEFFLNDDKRVVFRMVGDHAAREQGWDQGTYADAQGRTKESIEKRVIENIIPPKLPTVTQQTPTAAGATWKVTFPSDETPYVLSPDAVSNGWLPPAGVSCLPQHTAKEVPAELRYWEMQGADARAARDTLANGTSSDVRTEKARHARDKCMICGDVPTTVYLWAEGMAMAWFCDKCAQEFEQEHQAHDGFASDIDKKAHMDIGEDPRDALGLTRKKGTMEEQNGEVQEEVTQEEVVVREVWDTAYVNNLPDSAFLFIESGGEKDAEGETVPRSKRHFPVRDSEGNLDRAHVQNAIARIPQSNAPGLNKKALQDKARKLLAGMKKETFLAKMWDVVSKLFDPDEEPVETAQGNIVIIKENDHYRWAIITSTGFLDRDDEIISSAALHKAAANGRGDFGTLNYWHVYGGPDLGTCDLQFADGVCLVESGIWGNDEVATLFRKAVEKNPAKWAISIEAKVKKSTPNVVVNGVHVKTVYDEIEITKRSLLPVERSSNVFTAIVTDRSTDMDETKAKVLREVLGGTLAETVIAQVDAVNAAATQASAVVKEEAHVVAAPTPAVAETSVQADTTQTEADVVAAILGTQKQAGTTAAAPTVTNAHPAQGDDELLRLLKALGQGIEKLEKRIDTLATADTSRAVLNRPSLAPETVAKEGDTSEVPNPVSEGLKIVDQVAGQVYRGREG